MNYMVTLTGLPLDRLLTVADLLEREHVISKNQHEMLVALSERKIEPYDFSAYEHVGLKHRAWVRLSTGPRTDLGRLAQEALKLGWTCHDVGTALTRRPDWNHPHNKKLRWQLVQVQQNKLRPDQLE